MLYVVGTPIGNLNDISYRAINTLKSVDVIVAENPDHTRKLLSHFEIKNQVIRFHQQTKPESRKAIVDRLVAGEDMALVTDAGTPGISDPGGHLVSDAREAGVEISVIPGPSAVTAILSVCGMPTDTYMFIGFLPKKKGRMTLMDELANLDVPIVLFESPMRVAKTCKELADKLGNNRRLVIGRELTKMHEEIVNTTLGEAAKHYQEHQPKGEFVLVIASH